MEWSETEKCDRKVCRTVDHRGEPSPGMVSKRKPHPFSEFFHNADQALCVGKEALE
jgi:hypothetical protein